MRTGKVISTLYDQLCQTISEESAGIFKRYPDQIRCRQGCDSCCRVRINILPVEFHRLRQAFQAMPHETQAYLKEKAEEKWELNICPLLEQGACSLYESRPVICRTHGYPEYTEVGVDRPPRISVCNLNFTDMDTYEAQDFINMDSIGFMIFGANQEFVHTAPVNYKANQYHTMLEVIK